METDLTRERQLQLRSPSRPARRMGVGVSDNSWHSKKGVDRIDKAPGSFDVVLIFEQLPANENTI